METRPGCQEKANIYRRIALELLWVCSCEQYSMCIVELDHNNIVAVMDVANSGRRLRVQCVKLVERSFFVLLCLCFSGLQRATRRDGLKVYSVSIYHISLHG